VDHVGPADPASTQAAAVPVTGHFRISFASLRDGCRFDMRQ